MAYAPGFLFLLKVPFWVRHQAGTLCLLEEGRGGRARRRHVCFPIIRNVPTSPTKRFLTGRKYSIMDITSCN